ncbi:Sensory transduction regulator OS=Tsukamurella paurometabola (strain ATCC 8368 / DSM / CCUG 35730 / CIP 100753 / JCM 10117 / KCTC 9821 / NBRC 16120 / NCIMB 702349 / NCTC 13040) OX=521096 GN=Tpau_2755 PE=4 SV=1 [Tsukamurella paurometabola]|uniref:Sensory transduction regulator n=1 Tax=Tsukamurella paurometabola (strain ATCC 8368 / DSM 20162 / CCUG 35730 / CIP 100753 / JCM 10117 / KCTC 9821 / NBRC 16120 / NCIMB 702349 / NCTC 13040) TaxID=521096 RepID=D5UST2_TSUPD|nr:hypothetical protein [Tsukamurella paurometabola]ADG79353.1 hypothetical protein Tpau_2755 [Tsukamurella paurometabola DSM 20162]SUP35212.1 Uncharacterised protein [Tsukamurella paurometabola]
MSDPGARFDVLRRRLESALGTVVPLRRDGEGTIRIEFGEAPASVQVYELTDGIDVYAVTQVIALDLPLTDQLVSDVEAAGESVQFGTLRLMRREVSADLVLQYTFPASELGGDALRDFVAFLLSQGLNARKRLVA